LFFTEYIPDVKISELEGRVGKLAHVYGGRKMLIIWWWRNLKEGNHLESLDVDGNVIQNLIIRS
jgi:hypothetical protein